MRLPRAARWLTGAVTTVQIFAAGYDGTESMRLVIDNAVVATWNNVGGDPLSGQFQVFEYNAPGAVAADDVRVEFVNDSAARDLRIDRIAIGGVTFQAEAPDVHSTGTWANGQCAPGYWCSEWLNCNGHFQFSTQPRPPGPIPGTAGRSPVDSDWSVVVDPIVATHPVVLAGPATFADPEACALAFNLVDSQGFDARLLEWEGQDGAHNVEEFDWLLLPHGRFQTGDGSIWEIGTLPLSGNGQWTARNFLEEFAEPPRVFLTIQTADSGAALVARARDVTTSGFEAALFSSELLQASLVPAEVTGYLAVQPAADSGIVTIGQQVLPYLFEELSVGSQLTNGAAGYALMADEEQSLDNETNHVGEPTSVLRLGTAVFAQDYQFAEADPFAIRIERVPDGIQLADGFRVRQVVAGSEFEDAVALQILPDGRILVAEENGLVWVVRDGVRLPQPFVDIRGELFNGFADEGGLSAIVADPDFAVNRRIYLLYTALDGNGGSFGRISRFTASASNPDVADPASKTILLGQTAADGLIQDIFHNVGDLEFGHDRSLLVSWGDTAGNDADDPRPYRSQDLDARAGKVLRINRNTGLGLPTNPFYTGNGSDFRSKVWLYGVRNAFRFAVFFKSSGTPGDPGLLWLGEVGRHSADELNIGLRGDNLGWPLYEGNDPYRLNGEVIDHTPPVVELPHPGTRCIIGGDFCRSESWPPKYHGAFLAADFVEGWMRGFAPDFGGLGADQLSVIGTGLRGITDMAWDASNERMYFLGRGADLIFNNETGLDGLFYLEYQP